MNVIKLSGLSNAIADNLLSLLVNGWMSGSYGGALLTQQCHSNKLKRTADKLLPFQLHGVHLNE